MGDPLHPAGLVRNVRAGREARRNLVPVLLGRNNLLDRGARVRRGQAAGGDPGHHQRQVAGGDQVVRPGLRATASPMPRGSVVRGPHPASASTSATAAVPTRSRTRLVARLPERTMPWRTSRRSDASRPEQRPGLVVLVVVLLQREGGPVGRGREPVVHRHRAVEVEGAALVQAVRGDQQRQLHRARGVVPGVLVAGDPGHAVQGAAPDRHRAVAAGRRSAATRSSSLRSTVAARGRPGRMRRPYRRRGRRSRGRAVSAAAAAPRPPSTSPRPPRRRVR